MRMVMSSDARRTYYAGRWCVDRVLQKQSTSTGGRLFAFRLKVVSKNTSYHDELCNGICVHWKSRYWQDILKCDFLRDTMHSLSGNSYYNSLPQEDRV